METKIQQVIATVLNIDPSLVTEDASSKTLENWDSLYHMNIILGVEEQYGITFTDDEIVNLTSYTSLAEAVKKHQGE